nr:hypothetical protein [Tanacetum cinerariifolium]
VMDAPTLPVSAKKNLGDPIKIRVDIVHPTLADVFLAATVVRTLAQHGEAIRGIHRHLQGVPINEEMNSLRFRIGMAEEENASLRGSIKTIEVIVIMPTTRQGANVVMNLEAVQAMIDQTLLRNKTTDDGSQNSSERPRRPMQPTRFCSYTDFMKCQTLNFKGTEGIVGLSQWVERWNQFSILVVVLLRTRTLGHDDAYAMTWKILKKKLTDKYCPKGKIKKLEIELWNLKVKGNDVGGYTQRFQELALMCTKFISNETDKVDKYISGLPDNIHGNVIAARPKTLNDAIELANDLMDQKLRTYAERQTENNRKLDNNNQAQQQAQQQLLKKQNVVQAYAVGTEEKKPYGRSKPLCPKCNYHHDGECAPKCTNCKKYRPYDKGLLASH